MSVIIDGTSGVNTPNTFAFKNRLIDGGFIINQRGYVSGTALSSGTYAHDRWKAGSGGCTYTFTQGSLGVPTTITITAGSLQQVIEGCNMAEGGTYVLSWTGTAQARFNGGTYGSSPLAVTGITAGANTTIEFNTGTVGFAQLEVGSQATSFDYRPYGTELALCQRYLPAFTANGQASGVLGCGFNASTTSSSIYLKLPVSARTQPTGLSISSASHFSLGTYGAGGGVASSISFNSATLETARIAVGQSGLTTSGGCDLSFNNASATLLFTGCEL